MKKWRSVFKKLSLTPKGLLHEVIDSLPVALFCKDSRNDFRITLWNHTAASMWGVSKEDAIGKTDFELWPHDVATFFRQKDMETLNERKTVFIPEEPIVKKDGQDLRWVRTWKVPMFDEDGHPTLLLGIAQDITAIKTYELETKEHERQLQSISNNAPGMFYQFKKDKNGDFSFPYVSRRSLDIFGVPADEIMQDASHIIDLIHGDDRKDFERSLATSIRNLGPWRWEGRAYDRAKTLRWLSSTSDPIRQDDGSIIWDGILLDLTLQKENEERIHTQEAQLAETNRLASLGEMAGSVAHEINTPLNVILFCAEQLKEIIQHDKLEKADMLDLTANIEETSQRIAKIIHGLRTFARDGSNDALETVDLRDVVQQTLNLCTQRLHHSGIRLEFTAPPSAILSSCRSVQIGQVVLNLLNNAFDVVTPQKKEAWIRIEIEEDQRDNLIRITNSGPKISEETRVNLFRPFFTTKCHKKGTGLGLSISQGIMRNHNGDLQLDETHPNTCFVVRIPRCADENVA